MTYTLEKVTPSGATTPVKENETRKGGSQEDFETTSKTRASDEAHYVKNHMDSKYEGVTIFEEDN